MGTSSKLDVRKSLAVEQLESRKLMAGDLTGLAPEIGHLDSACLWIPAKPVALTSSPSVNSISLQGGKIGGGIGGILPTTGPLRELWVPASKATNVAGNWPVTAFGNADFAFSMPGDFTNFVSAFIVVVPRSTTTTTYSLRNTVAQDGNATNVTTNQQSGLGPISLTANVLKEIDASPVLSSLTASSGKVGLRFEAANQAAMQVVGLRLVYSAPEATVAHDATLSGNGSSSSPLSVVSAPYATQAEHANTADIAALAGQAQNSDGLGGVPASDYLTNATAAATYLTVPAADSRYVTEIFGGPGVEITFGPALSTRRVTVNSFPFANLTGVPSGLADGDNEGLPLSGGALTGSLAVGGGLSVTGATTTGSLAAGGNLSTTGTLKVGSFSTPPVGASAANAGTVYFDSSAKQVKVSDGTQWAGVTTGVDPIYVKGTGLSNTNVQPAIIKVGGNSISRTNRGLTLVILDAATHAVLSTTTYDTIASTANATALASAINGMAFDKIGILASYDTIASGSLPTDLNTALANRGLSKISTATNLFRAPYSAIFRGASNGPVIESLGPASSTNPAPIATVLVEDTFAT